MEGRFWHADPSLTRTERSYIPNREIIINEDPHRFLVPPTWTKDAVATALGECRTQWLLPAFNDYRPSPFRLAPLMAIFDGIPDIEAYGKALDALFDARDIWGRPVITTTWGGTGWRQTDKARVVDFMLTLWEHRAVAWPGVTDPFRIDKSESYRTVLLRGSNPLRPTSSIIDTLITACSLLSYNSKSRMRNNLMRILLRRVGIEEVGDLTPNVVAGAIKTEFGRHGISMAKALVNAMSVQYGIGRVKHVAENYGPFGRAAVRTRQGAEFSWVLESDPALEGWQALGIAWVVEAENSKVKRIVGLNGFFDYLIANRTLPRKPHEFLAKGVELDPPFTCSDTQYYNAVFDFIDWVLDARFTTEDEHGLPMRLPGFCNPLKRKSDAGLNRGETHREVLPTTFMRMMLDILTEDDWTWTKNALRRENGDWFRWFEASTGQYKDIWSPVRAVGVWLKLCMPFRSFQICMLDSGEADTLIYDAQTRTMVQNKGPLASSQKPVAKGVLQVIHDARANRDIPILRINTNKTADINTAPRNRGYDCPYAPRDVVAMLAWLRDWQSKYNPIVSPTAWADVPELEGKKTKLQLQDMSSCFLFRDPTSAGKARANPMGYSRFAYLWRKLCDELERRLAAQGIMRPDGFPYELITKRDSQGAPLIARYDLHTLRVTQITAFYESGTPVEILMKIVGHATVVMTLYYMKLGPARISEVMDEAHAAVMRDEQKNLVLHCKNLAYKELKRIVAWNDEAGPLALAEGSVEGFMYLDTGICPVGCAKCDIGGPKISASKAKQDQTPVAGGRANCAACRFFISGPAFLHGLVAHFNVRSQAAFEKAGRRRQLEEHYETLEAERRKAEAEKRPFLQYREWQRVGTDLEDTTDALDRILIQMNALSRIIEQSRRILDEKMVGEVELNALIACDLPSLEAVFEETTEFDLVDRICRSSVFIQAVDPTAANIKRMRAYDRMLVRNGLQPAFLDLDEETSLRVGNELSRLFTARIGRENTLKLMDGTETLARLGFSPDNPEHQLLMCPPIHFNRLRQGVIEAKPLE